MWCLRVVGTALFTGCTDGTVHCWDVISGALRWSLLASGPPGSAAGPGQKDGIRRLDVVRDALFTCTQAGHVGMFRLVPASQAEAAMAAEQALWRRETEKAAALAAELRLGGHDDPPEDVTVHENRSHRSLSSGSTTSSARHGQRSATATPVPLVPNPLSSGSTNGKAHSDWSSVFAGWNPASTSASASASVSASSLATPAEPGLRP